MIYLFCFDDESILNHWSNDSSCTEASTEAYLNGQLLQKLGGSLLHTSMHMPLSDTGLVFLACKRGPFPPEDASAAETLSLSAQSPAGSLLSTS